MYVNTEKNSKHHCYFKITLKDIFTFSFKGLTELNKDFLYFLKMFFSYNFFLIRTVIWNLKTNHFKSALFFNVKKIHIIVFT